ncbi:MAG: hypothetical protein HFG41_04330 [Coprococcus sp.]|nr:hypothetical protein [Coprococcus sp.]
MQQKRQSFVKVILVIGCLCVMTAVSGVSAGCRSQDTRDSQSSQDSSEEALSSVPENVLEESMQKENEADVSDDRLENGSESGPESICIYICGNVASPGVYELPEGSRVKDAVFAAGGMSEQAAKEYLNQAALVEDGQKIYVPSEEEARDLEASGIQPDGGAGSEAGSESSAADGGRVNLNTAGKAELMSLSGIGKSRAEAILAYRREHGRFEKIEDIQKIEGIKEGIYSRIKDRLTV